MQLDNVAEQPDIEQNRSNDSQPGTEVAQNDEDEDF